MYSLFKTSTSEKMSDDNKKNTDDIFKIDDSDFDCHINGCSLRFNAEEIIFDEKENMTPQEENLVREEEVAAEEEKEEEEEEEEEEVDERIYVISMNGITYYYEHSLKDAQRQMLKIANNIVGEMNKVYGNGHVLVSDHNLREVRIVAPYAFFMLTYNYVIHELSIDYATKLK